MMLKATFSSCSLITAFLLLVSTPISAKQQQHSFEDLIAAADAVVAVEILSTDYTATAADGPMVAEARVLKSLKGPLSVGKRLLFTETAWVGPTFKAGEYRILFLEEATQARRTVDWRVLPILHARTDFFIEKSSVSDLSIESLKLFLTKIQELKDRPKKVVFGKSQ